MLRKPTFFFSLFLLSQMLSASSPDLETPLLESKAKIDDMKREGFSSAAGESTSNRINLEEPFELVVSFAGGGTSGVGTLEDLIEIDKRLFDKWGVRLLPILKYDRTIIAGTSTGSIIASLIKNKHEINPETGARYTLDDFLNMYMRLSPLVFKPTLRWLNAAMQAPLSDEELVHEGLIHLGNQKIKDTPGLVIMTTWKHDGGQAVMIAAEAELRDNPVIEAVRKSIAIPGFFKPITENGKSYMDGGAILDNDHPAAQGYLYLLKTYYRKHNNTPSQVGVLDIGAGACFAKDICPCKPDNEGGLCRAAFDNAYCQCSNNAQHGAGKAILDHAPYENVKAEYYVIDFPMGYPLSFTSGCLKWTMRHARNSLIKDKNLPRIVDMLYRYSVLHKIPQHS